MLETVLGYCWSCELRSWTFGDCGYQVCFGGEEVCWSESGRNAINGRIMPSHEVHEGSLKRSVVGWLLVH